MSDEEIQSAKILARALQPGLDDDRMLQLIRDSLDTAAGLGQLTQEHMIMFLMLKQVDKLTYINDKLSAVYTALDSLLSNSNDEWERRNNT